MTNNKCKEGTLGALRNYLNEVNRLMDFESHPKLEPDMDFQEEEEDLFKSAYKLRNHSCKYSIVVPLQRQAHCSNCRMCVALYSKT